MLPELSPPLARPAVAYFHGGGWAEGERAAGMYPWLCPLLAAHGFVTASVTYRLSRFAAFPAQIHDAKAAIRFLRANSAQYGVDSGRIGAWGDSAGGHLAALLGTTSDRIDLEGSSGWVEHSSRVQAVVARCAPSDFRRLGVPAEDWRAEVFSLLFGGRMDQHDDLALLASPTAHVDADAPPFLLVHGTEDETVPYEQSTLLAGALRAHNVPVAVHGINGGHHNMLADVDAPWGNQPWTDLGHEALEFFRRHLGDPLR
ncbi:MAG: alpha/beta hydrolase fold domain-containing protein [Mycobacteriales bacterium]